MTLFFFQSDPGQLFFNSITVDVQNWYNRKTERRSHKSQLQKVGQIKIYHSEQRE